QKAMTEAQTKLQNGDKTLNDTTKADLAKQIDKLNTELQRMNDDAQKDLGDLQQQLFKPIAEKTQDVLKAYSAENGFAVVFDTSRRASSIILNWEAADTRPKITRKVVSPQKKPPPAAASPAAPKPPAPTAPKP